MAEWATRSMPSASGDWFSGVAWLLSHRVRMPRARERGDRREVLLLERQRVRAFEHDQARAIGQRGFEVRAVGAIDEGGRDAESPEQVLQHRSCPAVGSRDADHVVAARKARDHAGRHRARAAAEHQAVFGTFECGDLAAQDLDGRIVAARVDVLAELVAEPRAHRFHAREREDRGLHDRRRHCAMPAFALFAEVIEDVAQIHCGAGAEGCGLRGGG